MLQLRAKCGRGIADAAIQNALSLRVGEAGVAIQDSKPLDCFTSFAMTAFWIPVIATMLQLRAKRGRGVADAAIQMV